MSVPSYPTTRVLAMLELLQTHGQVGGPELSRRLGIGERTVRRYVTLLDDLGIPVETTRGRHGGYRLRPGYKLPPLMFGEDEALALVLGLLVIRHTALAGMQADVEGALGKVERVMPDRLRARVHAVREAVVLVGPWSPAPATMAVIGTVSEAAHRRRCVWLRYRSSEGATTERTVDVYGVVCYEGVWYVVGYDHLRLALRTFRVDRVREARLCDEPFTPPSDFDAVAYVEHAIASAPGVLAVEVLLETTLAEAQRLIPAAAATLEETAGGVLARSQVRDAQELTMLAHTLTGIDCSLIIHHPPALRDALRQLARHAAWLAERTAQ